MLFKKYSNRAKQPKTKKITANVRTYRAVAFFGLLALCVAGILVFNKGNAVAACGSPSGSYGTDTLSISVPSSGVYSIWVRMLSPSTGSNSVLLQVDGNNCYTVNDNGASNAWTWVNYDNGTSADVMSTTLSQGTHSIEIIGNAAGVAVDRLEFLTDASCAPSGVGDNCAPPSATAPTVAITSPSQGATVSGTVPINVNAASAPGITQIGISKVVISVDGKVLGTGTTGAYSVAWDSTTVTNGSHTLTAVATDSQGQSTTATETVVVSNPVPCTALPSVPVGVVANATSADSVSVAWKASTAPAGCTLQDYQLFRDGTEVATTAGLTTTYNDIFLQPATTYTYTVRAVDNDNNSTAGASASSAAATVTTPAAPDKTPPSVPTNVSASLGTAANSVNLSWSASTDNTGGTGLGGYYVIRNGVTVATVTYAGAISVPTTYTDRNVVPSTKYTYTVESFDKANPPNVSAQSVGSSVTTPIAPDTQPPTTPSGLVATSISSSQINLSWTASTDNVAVSGYSVYRNGSLVATTTTNSYGDTNLSAATSYSYYVIAFDAAKNKSSASATVSASTKSVAQFTYVYGKITDSKTGKPIVGALARTGNRGTSKGAAKSYTNSSGQYILTNIISNRNHDYFFSARNYKALHRGLNFGVGQFLYNVNLSVRT
jgi:chitodextrinase